VVLAQAVQVRNQRGVQRTAQFGADGQSGVDGIDGSFGFLLLGIDASHAAQIVRHRRAVEGVQLRVQALDTPQDHQRPVEVLHPAAQAHQGQQVVGDLRVLLPQRVLAPVNGQLQPVIGIGEFAGGGAHAGQALQYVVAHRVFPGRLLGQFPSAGEGQTGALVIALQVEGIAILGELRNGGRGVLLRREGGGRAGQNDA
jgi:hypothetical protein